MVVILYYAFNLLLGCGCRPRPHTVKVSNIYYFGHCDIPWALKAVLLTAKCFTGEGVELWS